MKSKKIRRVTSLLLTGALLVSTVCDSGIGALFGSKDTALTVHAETAHATVINEYWYNGHPSINPQPDNTFTYFDGSTHNRTFTSEYAPSNMEIAGQSFSGVTEIKVNRIDTLVQLGWASYVPITVDQIDYLTTEANKASTIKEQMIAAGSLGASQIMQAAEAMGLTQDDSWSTFTAMQYGYTDIESLQSDVNKMFYYRNLWRLNTDGVTSWCLEPLDTIGGEISQVDPTSVTGTDQKSYLLGLILTAATQMGADTDNAVYVAAQALVWELMGGLLNYNDLSHTGTSGYYNGMIVGNGLQTQYEAIKTLVARWRKTPSFLTGDMEYERTGNCITYYYGATWNEDHFDIDDEMILKDWNGLVLEWTWTDTDIYHFEPIDANTLRVTAKEYSATPMGATKFRDKNADNTVVGSVVYASPNSQDQTVYRSLYDPYGGWMNIMMQGGTSIKTDKEDGFPVMGNTGAQITIAGPGYDGTTVYDVNELEQLYEPGTYTITEIHAPTFEDEHLGYVKDAAPITITITDETDSNWYTYAAQSLADTRQKGIIQIQKKDEAKTYLNHFNEYAEYIDCTVCHNNFLTCEHTVEEWNAALEEYTANSIDRGVKCVACGGTFPQCRCDKEDYIEAFNATAPVDIDDAFYDGHDMRIVNPLPQGDATLAGAEFEIYAEKDIILANGQVKYTAGQLVETITTDESGLATSSSLDLGVYRVKEKTPPTGYQYWRYKAADELQFVVDIVYTGDENQASQIIYLEYGDSVIAGHVSVSKVVSHDDDNDIFDNDATNVETNIPAEGVYYAIYLKSKESDDDSSYANTRLPDEFFIPNSLDNEAPICAVVEGEGEIIDGLHYGCYEWIGEDGDPTGEKINPTLNYPVDETRTNAAIKSLYMILRTNAEGKAASYDARTVAYINIPGIAGGADNDAGRTDTSMSVINNSYPLPYGTYSVVELNPPEGYDWGTIEVNGVKGEHGQVVFDVVIGDECIVQPGEAPHTKTEANDHHYDIVNDIIQQKIYVYKVDNEYYVRETGSQGGEEIFELVPESGVIKQSNIKFKLWCWNNSGNGEYGLTYDAEDIGNEDMGYWYTYTYYDYPNEVTVDTFATDDEGMFVLPTPLVYGDYAFVELNAPYGYWLPDSNNTDIEDVPKNEDGSYQSWIGYVDPDTGEFVYTVDKYGNTYETPIAAAQFSVTNPDPDIIVTVDIENEAQKGYIVLSKTGLRLTGSEEVTNGNYTETHPIYEEMGLVGSTYALYADGDVYTGDFLRYRDGEKVAEFTTDNRGLAVSEPVHLGKYILKETKAPFGYLLDETEYSIELTYQGEEVRIYPVEQEKYDVRQEVEFQVYKEVETADGSFVPARGGIRFGIFADQDFTNHLGEVVIEKDSLIEVVNVADGQGSSSLMLPVGKYYIKELETDSELALDYNKYPIEFKYTVDGASYDNPDDYNASVTGSGKGETTLVIKLNEGVALKNYRKRANVELFKSDADAPATLVPVETEEVWMFDYDNNNIVDQADMDFFAKLVSGSVSMTEDYLKMSDIDSDGVLSQIDADALKAVINDPAQNKKVIIGRSKETGQNMEVSNPDTAKMLEGIEFTLYDANNVEIATLVTNEYGYASYDKGLTIGKYSLVETKSLNGYKFDVDNPLSATFEVTTDMYNTILTYQFENQQKDGLKIIKQDSTSGAPLAGCEIVIKDESGNEIVRGTTNNDGIAIFDTLEPGKYIYQETKAPAGYQLDSTEYTFEIVADAGLVEVVFRNAKIPAPDNQETPTGIIKIYFGKGVWNPALGALVDVETTAITSPDTEPSETLFSSNYTFMTLGGVALTGIAIAIFIAAAKKRRSNEE